MAATVRDWRIELIEDHPDLFHPEARPEAADGYPNCEGGWRDLLERACDRIETALAEGGALRVLQIKEKFGALRFYWSGDMQASAKTKVEEAIALAEARSACICEVCGQPGRLFKRGGWLLTRCEDHAEGHPVAIRPGWENLRIGRTIDAGRIRIVSCRRYDRETDSFADVDPHTLDIEE